MKKTALLVSFVAAALAIGAGHFYLGRLEAEVSGGPKVALLVVSEDVPVGTVLSEKLLAVRDVPQAYVDSRQLRSTEAKKIVGARVTMTLRANDAVLWSDVAGARAPARMLSGLVERGMRAVAIATASGDFEGLLRPGDRVDVLFTQGEKQTDNGSTATLLQNLLVLSVGGSIAKTGENMQRSRAGSTVTVATSVEEAQVITQAKERGRLSFTLRNPDDIAVAAGVPETPAKALDKAALAAREARDAAKGTVR